MTDYVQACREKILGYSARVEKRTFVLRGGVEQLLVCGNSLFVFATVFAERKARNAKIPQMIKQTTPPEERPPEKPLKEEKRNKTARQEKTIVFFFIL